MEGVQVVEPVLPESRHGRVGHDDAAEGDQAAADEERVGDGGEVFVGRVSGDGLAQGGVEEFVDWQVLSVCLEDGAGERTDHLEVNVARDTRVDREPGSEIPAAEVDGRADDEVRDLGDDLGADESDPMVRFRLCG